jgi:membrane protease YdiL (CAAX protease family)
MTDIDRAAPRTSFDGWVQRRPVVAFFALACAVSWIIWLAHLLTGSAVVFYAGGVGPVAAAAVVTSRLGTQPAWLRRVLRWRVAPRFYVLVLAGPIVAYLAMNAILVLLGRDLDTSLLDGRLPAYASTWLAALWAGVVEEPGWRGFALPRLQQRYSPVAATLLLGVLWGLWHLPIGPLTLLWTVPLAFFYTWLYNRTHSVVLCMLLHAGITPAQEHLLLIGDRATIGLVQLGALIVGALALVVATRGRLGLPAAPAG